MSFSAPQRKILEEYSDRYTATQGNDAKIDLVHEAAEAVIKAHRKSGSTKALPTNVHKKVANWFRNHAKAQQARTPDPTDDESDEPRPAGKNKYAKTYKLCDAVNVLHRDKITEILGREQAGQSGGKKFLGLYPKALTEVMKSLDQEELDAAEALAEKWNKEGAPPDLQKKNRRKLGEKVNTFVEEIRKTMGVQLFVMAGYPSDVGFTKAKFESRPHRGNLTFTQSIKDWSEDAWEQWATYLVRQFPESVLGSDAEQEDDEEEEDDEALEVDNDGFAILPARGDRTLESCKRIIHKYITTNYRNFSSNRRARVRWSAMSKSPQTFFEDGHLPDGVVMRDPSHLRADEVSALWDLWVERQQQGEVGLVFTGCNPRDRREKWHKRRQGKARYVEVDDDDDDGGDDDGKHRAPTDTSDVDSDDSNLISTAAPAQPAPAAATKSVRSAPANAAKTRPPTRTHVPTAMTRPPTKLTTTIAAAATTPAAAANGATTTPPVPVQRDLSSPAAVNGGKPSRIAYLCQLSQEPQYLDMVAWLDNHVEEADFRNIADSVMGLPTWASWSFGDKYLPADFHTVTGFDAAKALLHAELVDGPSQVTTVLGIGLGLRDIMRQMEIEPGDVLAGTPEWVANSELSVAQVGPLLNCPCLVMAPLDKEAAKGMELRKRKVEDPAPSTKPLSRKVRKAVQFADEEPVPGPSSQLVEDILLKPARRKATSHHRRH